MFSLEIQRVIQILSKMPGLGQRSARRAVLHLLKNRDKHLDPLVRSLTEMVQKVRTCKVCRNYDTVDPCTICADPRRDPRLICIVEDVADLWALERTGWVKGTYHVLGGVLSALDGVTPEDLQIPALIQRIRHNQVEEVILALNATIEGQTTAHYLHTCFSEVPSLKVTALAHGVPMGGELDYLDEGTLMTALVARRLMG